MFRTSILVKIFKNHDFGQNFRKFLFESKFSKSLTYVKKILKLPIFVEIFENLDFYQNFPKITILVIISENFDFGKKKNSENSAFFQNCWKCGFRLKFSKNSILFKIFIYLDYIQNFRKLLILVLIFENLDFSKKRFAISQFWSNFSKNLNFGEKNYKIWTFVEILENLDCGKTFRNSSFLSKFSGENNRFL